MKLNDFARTVSAFLILNISGLTQLVTLTQASENTRNPMQFMGISEEKKNSIQALGKDLFIQIKNPGTISANQAYLRQGKRSVVQQLNEFNRKFKTWKSEIESYLASNPAFPETAEIESEQKILLISDYFGTLMLLASIQSHSGQLNEANQSQWIRFTALEIPTEAFGHVTGYDLRQGGANASWYLNVLSDPNSPLEIQPDLSNQVDRILIALNPKVIQGTIELAKTNTPHQKIYLETLKKIILSKIQSSHGTQTHGLNQQQKESIFREILVKKIPIDQIPEFVTENLVQTLLQKIVGEGQQIRPGVAEKIFSALQSAEASRFEKSLMTRLATYPSFVSISDSTTLASIIADAKMDTVIPVFSYMRITDEARSDLETALNGFTAEYSQALSQEQGASIASWLKLAQNELKQAHQRFVFEQNLEHIQDIQKQAQQAFKNLNQPESETVIVPIVLYMAAAGGVEAVQPSRTVRNLLDSVFTAPDYRLARNAFLDLLNQKSLSEKDHAQLKALEKIFGFHSAIHPSSSDIRLSDIELPQSIRDAYRHVMTNEILANPLLTIPVGNPAQPLYQAIGDSTAQKSMSQTTALIQEAQKKSNENSTSLIQKVNAAQDIHQIKSLIIHSRLLESSLMEQYPELKAFHSRLLQQLQDESKPGPLRILNESYHKPMMYMLPLFVADAILFFCRPTRPFVRGIVAFQESFMPHVSLYLMSTLPLIVTDFALLGHDAYQLGKTVDQERGEYFYASQSANALFSYWELLQGKEEASANWTGLATNVGMTAAFLGSPFLARGAKNLFRKIVNHQYTRHFETLGVQTGSIQWTTTSIQENASIQAARVAQDASLGIAQKAKTMAKIRSSQQSLLKTLSRHEKIKAKYLNDFKSEFDVLGIPASERGFDLQKIDIAFHQIQIKATQGLVSTAEVEKARKAAQQLERFVIMEYIDLSRLGDVQARSALFRQVYGFQLKPEEQFRSVVNEPDYYALLGIESTADLGKIKQSYYKLVQQYHPDRNRDNPNLAELQEKFIQIQKAWEVLGNPAERARYDLDRARNGANL